MKKLQSLLILTTLFIVYSSAFQRPNTKNTEKKLYQRIQTDGFEHLNLIKHQDHIIENDIEDGAAMAQTSSEEIS